MQQEFSRQRFSTEFAEDTETRASERLSIEDAAGGDGEAGRFVHAL